MTNATLLKISSLRLCFREQILDFVDDLDRAGIPYAIGDALRDTTRERELWTVGRKCFDQAKGWSDARAWVITGFVRTNVFPGSGKGPHPYGLAIDIYPTDENKRIMANTHPHFSAILSRMWELAEKNGIDALGHKTGQPNDEYWGQDPSHYQYCGWRQLVEKEKSARELARLQA